MCEWLSSSSEWCDVQLQCGGRLFGAHRAVLASVSTFLRNILLSCPSEESPTFIVLPDFDIEAMSSVLYYIYNGEVVIEKRKLEVFLDIIKAMQIFIDKDYLPARSQDDTEMYSRMHIQSSLFKSKKVFSLGSIDSEDQQYVNLKKRHFNPENFPLRSVADLKDKQEKYLTAGWRDQSKSSFGNLQSPDRQRTYLRDLFMETYPQNGNANGRAGAGVLAISSERYRLPTSVLLTNANSKHQAVDNTYTSQHAIYASGSHDDIKTIKGTSVSKKNDSEANPKKQLFDIKSKFKSFLTNPNQILQFADLKDKCMPYLDLSRSESISSSLKIAQHVNQYYLDNKRPFVEMMNVNHCKESCNEDSCLSSNSNLVRGVILNQVMESPWCPRLPRDYRPFRRKLQSTTNSLEAVKEDNLNDSNNNIQSSTLTPNPDSIPDKDSIAKESAEHSTASYSIASRDDNDYTCTLCNQVFTTDASLSSHMHRHSTSARYNCTECSKSFSQLRNFKYHMSVHRGTKEFAATCTVCGKYFNDRGYLSSHMKIHRNRKEYKCSQCPKSFNQRVAYNMHVRIHTGVKPHVCVECGKAFSRKMLLKQHQRTHSGERPYACPHCDKRFADRSNMTLHLRLHTGIKPFSCTLCPKSFTKKHHLKSHLNFHTGAKPYSCPRCKLSFTQSSNMRTHLKKCTAPVPDGYTGASDS